MSWATCTLGHAHWGPRGAAGLLLALHFLAGADAGTDTDEAAALGDDGHRPHDLLKLLTLG